VCPENLFLCFDPLKLAKVLTGIHEKPGIPGLEELFSARCQWLSCTTFNGIFDVTIAFLDPENVDFNVLYAILLTFWITSLCVVVLMSDHLGKWRRVRTSNDVFTQFCDPHTPMIDF